VIRGGRIRRHLGRIGKTGGFRDFRKRKRGIVWGGMGSASDIRQKKKKKRQPSHRASIRKTIDSAKKGVAGSPSAIEKKPGVCRLKNKKKKSSGPPPPPPTVGKKEKVRDRRPRPRPRRGGKSPACVCREEKWGGCEQDGKRLLP